MVDPGIYVGDNKVVHFTWDINIGSGKNSSFRFSSSVSSFPQTTCQNILDDECGFRKPESGVTLSCLDCFLYDGSLCRFEYSVSKASCIAKRGGTCTTSNSDPREEIIHRVMYLLQHGFGKYRVLRNNCEDFALYCKTGLLIYDENKRLGSSGKAGCVVHASQAAVRSSPLTLIMSPAGWMSVTAGLNCWSRCKDDIGVRKDVVKSKSGEYIRLLRFSF